MSDDAQSGENPPEHMTPPQARLRRVVYGWTAANAALLLFVVWLYFWPQPGAPGATPQNQPTTTAIVPQFATATPTSAGGATTTVATPTAERSGGGGGGGAAPTATSSGGGPTATPTSTVKPTPTATPTSTPVPPTPTYPPTPLPGP
ncbi:MAG TPA: hypothetical protein VF808_11510 [Ktedonobacterales bacterium]